MGSMADRLYRYSNIDISDLIVPNGSGYYVGKNVEEFIDLTGVYNRFIDNLSNTAYNTAYSSYELLYIFKALVEISIINKYENNMEHSTELTADDIISHIDVLLFNMFKIENVYDTLTANYGYTLTMVEYIAELFNTSNDMVPFIWNITGDVNYITTVRLGLVERIKITPFIKNCRYSIFDYSLKKDDKDNGILFVMDLTDIYNRYKETFMSLGADTNLSILTFRYMYEEFLITARYRIAEYGDTYLEQFESLYQVDIESNTSKIANDFSNYIKQYHNEYFKNMNISLYMKTICDTEVYDAIINDINTSILSLVNPNAINRVPICIPIDWFIKYDKVRDIIIKINIIL